MKAESRNRQRAERRTTNKRNRRQNAIDGAIRRLEGHPFRQPKHLPRKDWRYAHYKP